jgi:thioredoxin-dependent peroxiredoxin
MSKKTRKKSPGTPPVKAARGGAKSAAKSVRSTGRVAAAKSAKTPVKTPAKKASKAPAKAAPKASRKAASNKPSAVRAKPSAPETVVKSKLTVAKSKGTVVKSEENLAAPATEMLAATVPFVAPAPAPSPEIPATEGGPAPKFDLPRDGGERVSLSDYSGSKLVIFFYPRADTPGCTREAIDFTRLKGDFAAIGTAVLGVSADPLKAQESFRNKHQLSIPLISDETHEMLQAYGAWGEKSMYGRTFQGVLRTTVLIDGNGRVARIWRGVKVDGHADAVLEAAREL